jgi:cardiolipin synthase A/B
VARPITEYVRALEGLLGTPATTGNHVTRLRNGDEIFPAMLAAIEDADRSIDFLTFVYWQGDIATRFAEALCRKQSAGVRVRLVLDTFGARLMENELIEHLDEAGVQVHWFRPPSKPDDWSDLGNRTHRKILVVDERVAFTGGVGIASEWEGDARDETEWRDSHFRVEGPAVDGLRAAFADDWLESEHELFGAPDRFPVHDPAGEQTVLVARGEAESGWSDIALLKRALCELAEDRIRITTAYFSPDEEMTRWLLSAARRGVEVEVLMPGRNTDKRLPQLAGELRYEPLLDAGVRVHRYEPTMLHAKILTVDGVVSNVGSANFNSRSMGLDEEVDLVVFDPELTGQLDADFDEDLTRSVAVDPEEWRDRGIIQRAAESVVERIEKLV